MSVIGIHEEEVTAGLLLAVLDAIELVDAGSEVRRISPERNSKEVEERVHPGQEALGGMRRCLEGVRKEGDGARKTSAWPTTID